MKTCKTCKWYREEVKMETARNTCGEYTSISYYLLEPDKCTLTPKHIEVTPNHFCGQWETPNE